MSLQSMPCGAGVGLVCLSAYVCVCRGRDGGGLGSMSASPVPSPLKPVTAHLCCANGWFSPVPCSGPSANVLAGERQRRWEGQEEQPPFWVCGESKPQGAAFL